MSTVTETNPRLLALTEAGVSVWLDQIRRSLVESGELARMIAEDCLRGMTANPSIFEKAILGSTDYDEELEAARARAARRDGDLRAARDARCAACGRRAGRRASRIRWTRRVRLARGLARPRPRHRGHARRGALLLAAAGPSERDDQDPGHAGGRAGDRAGAIRGDQRQRHAAVRGGGIRGGGGGVHPRAGAPADGWPAAGRQLGRVVLRLARRHERRPQARRARPHRPARQGGDRQRAARLPPVQGDIRRAALGGAAPRRRRRAAAAVGLDQHEGPALPGHDVRRGAGGGAHGQHDAAADAAGGR